MHWVYLRFKLELPACTSHVAVLTLKEFNKKVGSGVLGEARVIADMYDSSTEKHSGQ